MKIVWIVDAGYMLKAAPAPFDYLLLKKKLEDLLGAEIFESYYLNSTPQVRSDGQESFNTWLKSAPPSGPKMRVQLYRLKSLRCYCPACEEQFDRNVQQGVDVAITTLMLKLAMQNQYDRLVLSSGDGDFEDAIAYLKSELHKEIWLCGFSGSVSPDLQSYANHVLWLNDHWDAFKKEPRDRAE